MEDTYIFPTLQTILAKALVLKDRYPHSKIGEHMANTMWMRTPTSFWEEVTKRHLDPLMSGVGISGLLDFYEQERKKHHNG